jgi:hypothetical protein
MARQFDRSTQAILDRVAGKSSPTVTVPAAGNAADTGTPVSVAPTKPVITPMQTKTAPASYGQSGYAQVASSTPGQKVVSQLGAEMESVQDPRNDIGKVVQDGTARQDNLADQLRTISDSELAPTFGATRRTTVDSFDKNDPGWGKLPQKAGQVDSAPDREPDGV